MPALINRGRGGEKRHAHLDFSSLSQADAKDDGKVFSSPAR
jgi:hypothetical protein